VPRRLLLIAGAGVYPRLLAESARAQGVGRLTLIGFRGETDPAVARLADETYWVRVGQMAAFLDAVRAAAVPDAVMAGQISPTSLFRLRPDRAMFDLLASLRERNAETIFGAVVARLAQEGVRMHPASRFMERTMPEPGVLARRAPDARESADIDLGRRVAKATSSLEIGQTVVVKEGTILAVEAFEGTDEAILRGGKLGGRGSVVVKTAKAGHDMRFDIPVVGLRTMKSLRKAGATALAVEARRTILLEREALVAEADRMGLAFVAFEPEGDVKRGVP
jgi:hypothetical protein